MGGSVKHSLQHEQLNRRVLLNSATYLRAEENQPRLQSTEANALPNKLSPTQNEVFRRSRSCARRPGVRPLRPVSTLPASPRRQTFQHGSERNRPYAPTLALDTAPRPAPLPPTRPDARSRALRPPTTLLLRSCQRQSRDIALLTQPPPTHATYSVARNSAVSMASSPDGLGVDPGPVMRGKSGRPAGGGNLRAFARQSPHPTHHCPPTPPADQPPRPFRPARPVRRRRLFPAPPRR